MHDSRKDKKTGNTDPGGERSGGGARPAHWQGEPLPERDDGDSTTQDIGFDKRGAGRARQYGKAGAYGQSHNEKERRPVRGSGKQDRGVKNGDSG